MSASASLSSQWRTPTDDTRRGGPQSGQKRAEGGHTINLQDQVQDFGKWPTPDASEARLGFQDRSDPEKKGSQESLSTVAMLWPTPRSHEVGEYQYSRGDKTKPVPTLTGAASSLPVHQTYPVGGISSKERRSLNPLFVEWLMGWPPGWTLLGWTDFACSGTALSAYKQLMRCALSQLALPPAAPPQQLSLLA
jgi:hypothetical protein